MRRRFHSSALAAALLVSCSRFGPVYPPRPPTVAGLPVPDPTPSRVVAHLSITRAALTAALDQALPSEGNGTYSLAGERAYRWQREPPSLAFGGGRVALSLHILVHVSVPLGELDLPLDVNLSAEPVMTPAYLLKLQSLEIKVSSTDRRLKAADQIAGVFDRIANELKTRAADASYDVRPLLADLYARATKPMPMGIAQVDACAELGLLGVEAGPTVLADGFEKDIALLVAPSVTVPCAASGSTPPLPPLANVAALPSGPFTVTVPIAARYEELTSAMAATAFTDGKLFFSQEHPGLYLEKPELYESQGALVLKLHLTGPVHELGIHIDIDGDIFLTGHVSIVDNELQLPDLEPTIETSSFLLSLKALSDGAKIRESARAALRLDLAARLKPVREKLATDLTFGDAKACARGYLDRIEVAGAYPHGSYLRVHVLATGRMQLQMPCSE